MTFDNAHFKQDHVQYDEQYVHIAVPKYFALAKKVNKFRHWYLACCIRSSRTRKWSEPFELELWKTSWTKCIVVLFIPKAASCSRDI